jgi:DNA-binding CsgD family transcriptional regulator
LRGALPAVAVFVHQEPPGTALLDPFSVPPGPREDISELADVNGRPLLTYQVLLALNHFLAGEWDDAVAELEAGIAMADEAGETYLLPLGLLDRAAGIYEGLEAARDVARTEATMRQLGIRRGVRGPRGRPQTGWPSLTVTERTVADLVADGLSNPQIGERLYISRRTVQTHVAHIFMKLGVSSRAQLAAEVIRQPGRG